MRTAQARSSDNTNAIRNLTAVFNSYFFFLLNIVYESEEAIPTNAREARMIRAVAPPDEDRLAHDVVLRHETPVAAVG